MKRLVLIPLILCISTPQYLVLSIDQEFYAYKYGETTNFIWQLLAITAGILLSFILNKYLMATFLILVFGILGFIAGCVDLHFRSMGKCMPYHYFYGLLLNRFAIGLVQHNLAAVYGDQFISSTFNHFLVYVFINMIGICFSRIVSVLLELKQFFGINCLKVDCFTCIYVMCLILSGIGLGILILMLILRKYYVIPSLVHKPMMDTNRFKIYCSIFMPLIGFMVIVFGLEQEIFFQANELNRYIAYNFYIEHFHLHILYYFLTLLCVPLALLMERSKSKPIDPIAIGCILICLANFYFGLLHLYAKESYNVYDIPVDPSKTTLQIINYFDDLNYNIDSFNLVGYLPYSAIIGPFRYERIGNSSFTFNTVDADLQPGKDLVSRDFNISIPSTPLINGRLFTILLNSGNFEYYLERTFRAPSGYALLRYWCNDELDKDCYQNICLYNTKINISFSQQTRHLIKEIPADLYHLMYNNVTIATYLLGSGSSNLLYFDCDPNVIETVQCSTAVTLIPSFKLSIYGQFVLYILLSVAKGMIYSAALQISYFIGSDNQKSMYIGCLYLFYIAAWILYMTCENFVEFFTKELRKRLTIILVGGTIWFYYNYQYRSHLLNRINSFNDED